VAGTAETFKIAMIQAVKRRFVASFAEKCTKNTENKLFSKKSG
jgi:hypothetical protein